MGNSIKVMVLGANQPALMRSQMLPSQSAAELRDIERDCFFTKNPPDRCPDCGAQTYKEKPAVLPAINKEINELLRIQAEDKENSTLLSGENI